METTPLRTSPEISTNRPDSPVSRTTSPTSQLFTALRLSVAIQQHRTNGGWISPQSEKAERSPRKQTSPRRESADGLPCLSGSSSKQIASAAEKVPGINDPMAPPEGRPNDPGLAAVTHGNKPSGHVRSPTVVCSPVQTDSGASTERSATRTKRPHATYA